MYMFGNHLIFMLCNDNSYHGSVGETKTKFWILCVKCYFLDWCFMFLQPEEFDNLSMEEKTHLKWQFLLKRFASRLVILPTTRNQQSPLISLLAIEKVSLTEYAARLPMYWYNSYFTYHFINGYLYIF